MCVCVHETCQIQQSHGGVSNFHTHDSQDEQNLTGPAHPQAKFIISIMLKTMKRSWQTKLQALVYDILPRNTAVIDYAIGLEKLSANKQVFVGDQMAESL